MLLQTPRSLDQDLTRFAKAPSAVFGSAASTFASSNLADGFKATSPYHSRVVPSLDRPLLYQPKVSLPGDRNPSAQRAQQRKLQSKAGFIPEEPGEERITMSRRTALLQQPGFLDECSSRFSLHLSHLPTDPVDTVRVCDDMFLAFCILVNNRMVNTAWKKGMQVPEDAEFMNVSMMRHALSRLILQHLGEIPGSEFSYFSDSYSLPNCVGKGLDEYCLELHQDRVGDKLVISAFVRLFVFEVIVFSVREPGGEIYSNAERADCISDVGSLLHEFVQGHQSNFIDRYTVAMPKAATAAAVEEFTQSLLSPTLPTVTTATSATSNGFRFPPVPLFASSRTATTPTVPALPMLKSSATSRHDCATPTPLTPFRERYWVIESDACEEECNSLFNCFIRILVHFKLVSTNDVATCAEIRTILSAHIRKKDGKFPGAGIDDVTSFCDGISSGKFNGTCPVICAFVDLYPIEIVVYYEDNEKEPLFFFSDEDEVKHRATLLCNGCSCERDSSDDETPNEHYNWVRNTRPPVSNFGSIHGWKLPRQTDFMLAPMQAHIVFESDDSDGGVEASENEPGIGSPAGGGSDSGEDSPSSSRFDEYYRCEREKKTWNLDIEVFKVDDDIGRGIRNMGDKISKGDVLSG